MIKFENSMTITGYKVYIYTSQTCKECFQLKNQYQYLEEAFPEVTFVEVDVDLNRDFASQQEVYTLPSLEFFHNNQLIGEFKHGHHKSYDHVVNFIKVYKELHDNKQLLQ